jgi:SAM-dependent methyltransferase
VTTLAARDAYRLWAPTYAAETAISFLDDELARALAPPLTGKHLLDAGCGTGRRIARVERASAFGIDASFDMLAAGGARRAAAADVRALPFGDRTFDVVWCRLVLGHLPDPMPAYHELARVCRAGGHLFVTDFHAAAVAAGHRRSFRDAAGQVHEVEHYVHDVAAHAAMAEHGGLGLAVQRDAAIGSAVRAFYARAGRLDLYERDRGLPVVAAFLFRRPCDS